jgi:hypothetical protein
MISGGMQPGNWLAAKAWNIEPTILALEALISPSKEYPYVRLRESQENFWLEPVHFNQLSTEEGKSRFFREKLSSVELIYHLVTNQLKSHCSEVLSVSLLGLLEPQIRLKKWVIDKTPSKGGCTTWGRLIVTTTAEMARKKTQPPLPQSKRTGNIILIDIPKKPPSAPGPFVIGHLSAGGPRSAFRVFSASEERIKMVTSP